MNHRTLAVAAIAASLALSLSANAAPRRTSSDVGSDHFSVTTGETVATNHDMVSAEAGFPGFTFGYTHGMNDHFDAGLKLDLLYGHRFTTLQSQFGMGLRAPLRYIASRQGRASVMLHADPGFDFYTAPSCPTLPFGFTCNTSSSFGIGIPVGITVGYQATSEVRVAAGADLPLVLSVSPSPAYLQIGPLFGGSVEYFFERQWTVGFNVRFGPQFYTVGGSSAQLGFVTEATLGYRL